MSITENDNPPPLTRSLQRAEKNRTLSSYDSIVGVATISSADLCPKRGHDHQGIRKGQKFCGPTARALTAAIEVFDNTKLTILTCYQQIGRGPLRKNEGVVRGPPHRP